MTTLPRPDVTVSTGTSDGGSTIDSNIVVTQDGKSRSWAGNAPTIQDSVKEGIKKMLDDPVTAEYLPAKRGNP